MWFVYALIAAIFSAINRALIKNAGSRSSDITITFSLYLFASVPALIMSPWITIPVIESKFYHSILLAATTDIAGIVLMSKALRYATMGRTVPLLSFTPAALLLTAFLLLGEIPTLIGALGVLIIVVGSYLLHLERNQESFLTPFRLLTTNKGARYMLGTAACFSFTGPFYKQAILSSSPTFALIIGLPLSVSLLLIYQLFRRRKMKDLFPESANRGTLIALGLCIFIVAISTNLAFDTGLVSYVISIKRLSIFFNVIIGFLLFKEEHLLRNLLASTVMILGATLIILQ